MRLPSGKKKIFIHNYVLQSFQAAPQCVIGSMSRVMFSFSCAAMSSTHLGVVCKQCGLWLIRNTDLDLIIQIGGITRVERQMRLLAWLHPIFTPLLPPSSSSSSSSSLRPPSALTLWPLPHITYGSPVRRKGDLTANLACWRRSGPSMSQMIPVFSWPLPTTFYLSTAIFCSH